MATLDEQSKQLVVAAEDVSRGRPAMTFALTDAQFERALSVFQPPKPSKVTLWTSKVDPEFMTNLTVVGAFLDSIQYVRPRGGGCFTQPIISTHFDNVVLLMKQERSGGDDDGDDDDDKEDDVKFSIDEWYTDTRGEIPKEMQDWDPHGIKPMPHNDWHVDWVGALTNMEEELPGFVALFAKCIKLEEETTKILSQRKYGASTAFGDHPSERTAMPLARDRQATMENFTPSGLLSGTSNGSNALFSKPTF